jgi:transcriptional regulator with XRE-family HTH domain
MSLEHDVILDAVRDPIVLGKALRLCRKAAGMTQEEAGAKMEMARTTIVAIESGYRYVRVEELQAFASLYRCDVLHFFEEEKEPPAQPVLSARKRVLKRILSRESDPTMVATLQALAVSQREMERMAATLLSLLIEQEENSDHE